MRIVALVALLSGSACIQDHAGGAPPPPPVDLTIVGASGQTALVVVRDGPSGQWVAPTEAMPGQQWTITVDHAYTVAAVCHDQPAGGPERWRTIERAFAITDAVTGPLQFCGEAEYTTPAHAVVGTMVQAGQVQFGTAIASSTTPNWQIAANAPASPDLDVIASSADHAQILRNIDVTAIDATHPMPAIDVDANGVALVPVALTSNASAAETVQARVEPSTPHSAMDLTLAPAIYAGPLASVMVAPHAMYNDGEQQLVTVEAVTGNQHRSLTRSLFPGDATAFALPAQVFGEWSVAASDAAATPPAPDAPIEVTWGFLPEGKNGAVELDVDGTASDPASPTALASYRLYASPGYLQDATFNSLQIETDVPGFDPTWRVDPTQPYTRKFLAPSDTAGLVVSSLVESITPTP